MLLAAMNDPRCLAPLVRVFETKQGLNTIQAELFPDISIGDAPAPDTNATPGAAAPSPVAPGVPHS